MYQKGSPKKDRPFLKREADRGTTLFTVPNLGLFLKGKQVGEIHIYIYVYTCIFTSADRGKTYI